MPRPRPSVLVWGVLYILNGNGQASLRVRMMRHLQQEGSVLIDMTPWRENITLLSGTKGLIKAGRVDLLGKVNLKV